MVSMDKQFKAPCINISLAVGLFAFNQLGKFYIIFFFKPGPDSNYTPLVLGDLLSHEQTCITI